MSEERPEYSPQMVALDLEVEVRQILAGTFGWVSLDSILFKLPKPHNNSEKLEKLVFSLADRGLVRINAREGRSLMVELVKPGYAPTAAVLPDPPPKVRKYVRPRDERIFVRPTAPPLLHVAPPGRRFQPVSPAKVEGAPMSRRSTEQVHAAIFAALAAGPLTRKELMEKARLSSNTAQAELHGLERVGKLFRTDKSRRAPWSLTKPGSAPAHTPTTAPRADVTDLRWSIRNDGVVTFITRDHQLEVDGITLERVIAARQAIAKAA